MGRITYKGYTLIPRGLIVSYKGKEMFKVGDPVSKTGSDYKFDGIVVAVFPKLSGQIRLVVEDDRGILHVYSEKNLVHRFTDSKNITSTENW